MQKDKDAKARQKRRNIEVLKKLFTIIKYADSDPKNRN